MLRGDHLHEKPSTAGGYGIVMCVCGVTCRLWTGGR